MTDFKKYKPFELFICPELNALPVIKSTDLEDLQGNLKDLSERNYKRLRSSIKENGFMVPLFVWFDPADGQGYTLDGNQRLRFIKLEYPQGVALPYIEISALDHVEAKQKILLISSNYGEVTKEGVDEFLADMPGDTHDWVADLTTFGNFLDQIPEPAIDNGPVDSGEITFTITVTVPSELDLEQLTLTCIEKGYSFSVL